MNTEFKKRALTGFIVLLAAAFIIPSTAGAFQRGEGKHFRGGGKNMTRSCLGIWNNQDIIEKLALSDDQVDKIKKADFDFREKKLPVKAKLNSLNLKMEKVLTQDNVKEEEILSIAKKISDSKEDMYILSIKSKIQLKKILTNEQINKLEYFIKDRRMNHRGNRGRHMANKNHYN